MYISHFRQLPLLFVATVWIFATCQPRGTRFSMLSIAQLPHISRSWRLTLGRGIVDNIDSPIVSRPSFGVHVNHPIFRKYSLSSAGIRQLAFRLHHTTLECFSKLFQVVLTTMPLKCFSELRNPFFPSNPFFLKKTSSPTLIKPFMDSIHGIISSGSCEELSVFMKSMLIVSGIHWPNLSNIVSPNFKCSLFVYNTG